MSPLGFCALSAFLLPHAEFLQLGSDALILDHKCMTSGGCTPDVGRLFCNDACDAANRDRAPARRSGLTDKAASLMTVAPDCCVSWICLPPPVLVSKTPRPCRPEKTTCCTPLVYLQAQPARLQAHWQTLRISPPQKGCEMRIEAATNNIKLKQGAHQCPATSLYLCIESHGIRGMALSCNSCNRRCYGKLRNNGRQTGKSDEFLAAVHWHLKSCLHQIFDTRLVKSGLRRLCMRHEWLLAQRQRSRRNTRFRVPLVACQTSVTPAWSNLTSISCCQNAGGHNTNTQSKKCCI